MRKATRLTLVFLCFLSTVSIPVSPGADLLPRDGSLAVPFQWSTFNGCGQNDANGCLAVDREGNIYVGGYSAASWGTPLRAFGAGEWDGFVAKYDPQGRRLWNTFLGGTAMDFVEDIFIDGSGVLHVSGTSGAGWGDPHQNHAGGMDAFIARLSGDGNLLWNTFLGCGDDDSGHGLVVDGSGNTYLTGGSAAEWGSPILHHTGNGSLDAFVAKLDPNGDPVWLTFLGGNLMDYGMGITVDPDGNALVGGRSTDTWGAAPLNGHAGADTWDAFIAGLDAQGNLEWNAFLGVGNYCYGVAGDRSGSLYLTGVSYDSFGDPVNPYQGSDIYVVKMSRDGSIAWNTFLGSAAASDQGQGLAVDNFGNVYVAARCDAGWGDPLLPYTGGRDGMLARLDAGGRLEWHAFMGSTGTDYAYAVGVSANGSVYAAGSSDATWGDPLDPYSGGDDGFLARFVQFPIISGSVTATDGRALAGTEIAFSPDADPEITNPYGRYAGAVRFGFSGTLTPAKPGYSFAPASRSVRNVTEDLPGQDFSASAIPALRIRGRVVMADGLPLAGVTLIVTVTDLPAGTGADGQFDIGVPAGWSGAIVPVRPLYGFTPARYEYAGVQESVDGQDFLARALLALSGERLEERAWVIRRPYGKLTVTVETMELQVSRFALQRRTRDSGFQVIREFTPGDFAGNAWTHIDRDIARDQASIYRVTAMDAAGAVVFASPEIAL